MCKCLICGRELKTSKVDSYCGWCLKKRATREKEPKMWYDNKPLYSQQELSDLLGVGKGTVSRWLNGTREMPYDVYKKLELPWGEDDSNPYEKINVSFPFGELYRIVYYTGIFTTYMSGSSYVKAPWFTGCKDYYYHKSFNSIEDFAEYLGRDFKEVESWFLGKKKVPLEVEGKYCSKKIYIIDRDTNKDVTKDFLRFRYDREYYDSLSL